MIAAALLACAANIAPVTLEAVIEVESRGDALPFTSTARQRGRTDPRTPEKRRCSPETISRRDTVSILA